MARRRVWCETLPLEQVRAPSTLALLRRYRLELLLAVRPWHLTVLPSVLDAARDAGVSLGLWPMLDDTDGRWANTLNAVTFCDFARATLDAGRGASELAVDLEPPIDRVATLFSVCSAPRRRCRRTDARGALQCFKSLANEVHARGVTLSAAVLPMTLYDTGVANTWQHVLGTPVEGISWSHVSVMAYTSIFEGWSRGALSRGHARELLGDCCARGLARFGTRAGVSLGAVHTGALGDEPVYRDASELADDVAIARAHGVDDLTLFDLAGVLRRPPAERWLDAFTTTEAAREAPQPRTSRTRALIGALQLVARLGARRPTQER